MIAYGSGQQQSGPNMGVQRSTSAACQQNAQTKRMQVQALTTQIATYTTQQCVVLARHLTT